MHKMLTFLSLFFVALVSYGQTVQKATDNEHNQVEIKALPSLQSACGQGFAASYAGLADAHTVVVAGGCNFPNRPAADGGAKVFYDEIYALSLTNQGAWKHVGTLPKRAAYGVSVSTPKGVLCMGGTDGAKSMTDVLLLRTQGGSVTIEQDWPALPYALDNMAGAMGNDGYVYVVGGLHNGEPSQRCYRLNVAQKGAWERLPDMPGAARVQPAAAVQQTGTGARLYVMGGYAPAVGQVPAVVHTDGLAFDPATQQWSTVAPIQPANQPGVAPKALVGAVAVPSGCAHIVFMGGANQQIFADALNRPLHIAQWQARTGDAQQAAMLQQLQAEQTNYLRHPADWYHFNDELLIYHTVTDTWVTESRSARLARCGAALVAAGGRWLLVGGESKPGIRSADVTSVSMTLRPSFGWVNWCVLVAYLIGMVLMGYYFMRRESGADDFFKGGGRIPWWAAGISIYATMLSAITYMAYPAKAYATDWTYYPMLITILLVSFPVVRYYLPFFRRLGVTSAYEYLERRFNATTRLMASALFIVFMVVRMALVLYLPSLALTAVTGINIYVCIVLMAIVTILYCTMGGVEAVVWGDVVQGFILVGGAIFAVAYLVFHTEGGVAGFVTIGAAADKFRLFNWSFDYRTACFWVILLGGMANNLISYTSDQTVIQRYLTTKDEASARRSIMMNGVMSVVISIAFFAIGAGLYTFFKTHPFELDYTMAKTDIIFPFFIMSQLPQGIAGLLIAAIFAATMSTISSNINSVATAFSIDFYKRFRPATADDQMLRVARGTSLVAGVIGMGIALLMATWEINSLLDFFQEVLGLLSGGLGGLFLMGIFFPRIGGRAALTGFVAGVAAVFAVRYFTPASFLLYGAISIVVEVVVALLVSYILKESTDLKGLTWRTRNDASHS